MDNASNALIIAGVILIALIILTMGVYLAASHSQVAESYDNSMQEKERETFNNRFEAFRGRSDITPQEIYSLIQFYKQYNAKTGVEVAINGININNLDALKTEAEKFVEDAINKTVTYRAFECKEDAIKYNEETGMVKEITFTKKTITKDYRDDN